MPWMTQRNLKCNAYKTEPWVFFRKPAPPPAFHVVLWSAQVLKPTASSTWNTSLLRNSEGQSLLGSSLFPSKELMIHQPPFHRPWVSHPLDHRTLPFLIQTFSGFPSVQRKRPFSRCESTSTVCPLTISCPGSPSFRCYHADSAGPSIHIFIWPYPPLGLFPPSIDQHPFLAHGYFPNPLHTRLPPTFYAFFFFLTELNFSTSNLI